MNTSDSWPRSTVALLAGISTSTSISMGSLWLSEESGRTHMDRYTHTHIIICASTHACNHTCCMPTLVSKLMNNINNLLTTLSPMNVIFTKCLNGKFGCFWKLGWMTGAWPQFGETGRSGVYAQKLGNVLLWAGSAAKRHLNKPSK